MTTVQSIQTKGIGAWILLENKMASCFTGGHFGPGSQEYIPVAEFYADKSVFVTGGTGFMGKASIFKKITYI